jgi:hypothetical protein
MDHFDLAGDLEAKEQARFEQQVRNFGRLLLAIILVLGFAWAWQDLVPALSVINGITVWTVAGVNGGPAVAVSMVLPSSAAFTSTVTSLASTSAKPPIRAMDCQELPSRTRSTPLSRAASNETWPVRMPS